MRLVFYLYILGFLFFGCTKEEKVEASNQAMLHSVYFYPKPQITPNERTILLKGIKELLTISEIKSYEIGVPADTEHRDVTDHDFIYSIHVKFATLEDHAAYQLHPTHVKFVEKYKNLWSAVKVYDSKQAN